MISKQTRVTEWMKFQMYVCVVRYDVVSQQHYSPVANAMSKTWRGSREGESVWELGTGKHNQ